MAIPDCYSACASKVNVELVDGTDRSRVRMQLRSRSLSNARGVVLEGVEMNKSGACTDLVRIETEHALPNGLFVHFDASALWAFLRAERKVGEL